jgi:hypothetical protein
MTRLFPSPPLTGTEVSVPQTSGGERLVKIWEKRPQWKLGIQLPQDHQEEGTESGEHGGPVRFQYTHFGKAVGKIINTVTGNPVS